MYEEVPGTSSAQPHPLDTTPVHKSSRRLKGLAPEYNPLAAPSRKMTSTVASQTFQQTVSSPPLLLHSPRTPAPFHGDKFEDVEDWLDGYDRVSEFNLWDEDRKLRNVYFALQDAAKTWFENHESAIHTWQDFRRQLLDTFSSNERRERAELALQSRAQQPNESVAMFVEDMTRLFNRADPSMSEAKKVRHLMRGVKEQLFAGLVRDPPATVADFAKEAAGMERALQQRFAHYGRSSNITAVECHMPRPGDENTSLRELIRSIVREELQKLRSVEQPPSVTAISEAVRDEIRRTVQPTPPPPPPAPYVMTYSETLRSPAPPPPAFYSPAPTAPSHRFPHTTALPDDRPPVTKANMWRTPNNRPLCFHCGEAGHIRRHCPYRRIGLRGFSPDAPLPRYGERPREIDQYLAANVPPVPTAQRQSRSPSPRRFSSPVRQSYVRQSSSPRREN